MPSRRAEGFIRIAVLLAVARATAQEVEAPEKPALMRLANAVVERLATSHPTRTGKVLRVEASRALLQVAPAAPGEILDLYAPEPEEPASPSAQSFVLLGRLKVVDVTNEGAWAEALAPLSIASVAPDQRILARRGPRRLALSVTGQSESLDRLASAIEAVLPELLRTRGFLVVDDAMGSGGSILADRAAIEQRLSLQKLDHALHLMPVVRDGEAIVFAEVASAGATPSWDLFTASAGVDEAMAALLGGPSTRGLRLQAAYPLPARPLHMAVSGGQVAVLTLHGVTRLSYREGGLALDGVVDLPQAFPRADPPVRGPAGFVHFADLDADGRAEIYLLANWLDLPARITPIAGSGAIEPVPEGILAVTDAGYLSGSFEQGGNAIAPSLRLRTAGTAREVELPFPILRALAWEGSHFLLLTRDYEIYLLKVEEQGVTPLSSTPRTGYAFDVAYDTLGERTILAASGMGFGPDQVVLQTLLPPEQRIARIDVSGVVEALSLQDLDRDGRLELCVAEGPSDASAVSRLAVFSTELGAR